MLRKTIFKKLEAQGLIANYNRLRKNLPPRLPERVFVWDDTLREGVQTPTVFLTYVEKVKLAKMMDEVGVSIIAVGYPALSEEEKNSVRRIANEGFQHASLAASAGIRKSDVDACLECGIREISIFTAFNGINLQYRLKMTKEQVLQRTVECVQYAKKHGAKVDFVLEDSTRTPLEDILRIFHEAVKAGADRLVIADTLGFLRPLSMRYLISHVKEGLTQLGVKEVPLSIHCHNDFGLATANVLAGLSAGADSFSGTFTGIGERAGNSPIEEVCIALKYLHGIDLGVKFDKLKEICSLVEKYSGVSIQKHKPIVGKNVFVHESGIHVNGVIKHTRTYENFDPEIVGQKRKFLFGKHSGSSGLRFILKDFNPSEEEIKKLLKSVKNFSEHNKKSLSESDVCELFKTVSGSVSNEKVT